MLIGLAVMGSLIVWTKEGVYMKQKYASRFNAGKKSFLSLVIPSKHSMVCKKAHITSIVTLLLLAATSIHLSLFFLFCLFVFNFYFYFYNKNVNSS